MFNKTLMVSVLILFCLTGCSMQLAEDKHGNDIKIKSNYNAYKDVIHTQVRVSGDAGGYFDVHNQLISLDISSDKNKAINIDGLFGKKSSASIVRFSTDAKRVLLNTYDEGHYLIKEEIMDCQSKKILFTRQVKKDYLDDYYYSPSLQGCLMDAADGAQYFSIGHESENKISSVIKNVNIRNCVFSPDEKKIAYVVEKEDTNEMCVVNIESLSVESITSVGKGYTDLSQWHKSGKLVYNQNAEVCILDMDKKTVNVIGKYMFYPMISPDSSMLVFTRPGAEYLFECYCSDQEIQEYREQQNHGLFIINLKDITITKISEVDNQIAIGWFESLEF